MRMKLALGDNGLGWTDLTRLGLRVAHRGWRSIDAIEDEIRLRERNIERLNQVIQQLTAQRDELSGKIALIEAAQILPLEQAAGEGGV